MFFFCIFLPPQEAPYLNLSSPARQDSSTAHNSGLKLGQTLWDYQQDLFTANGLVERSGWIAGLLLSWSKQVKGDYDYVFMTFLPCRIEIEISHSWLLYSCMSAIRVTDCSVGNLGARIPKIKTPCRRTSSIIRGHIKWILQDHWTWGKVTNTTG